MTPGIPARKDTVDVVVIGSGAGGAPVALTLAQAGAQVVVLEKGPYYSVRDFTHDEVAICRRNFFIPSIQDDPHTIRKGDETQAHRTIEGWISQCVGGGTVHMSGFSYRFNEKDLRLKSLTGGIADAQLADWPLTLAELTPYYDRAEVLLGMSGQAGTNPFEPPRRPFPLPAVRQHPAALLIDEAGSSLHLHPFPTQRALLSRAYGGRPPCNYCGFCGEYGCENGSKSSMLSTLIPEAEATGRCEIRAGCMACRINVDEHARAHSVEYVQRDGSTREIFARVVVLAASAIESARLLLLSTGNAFPHGLANGSGLVGKNLTFSTFGKSTAIFDRQALTARLGLEGMSLPFLQRSCQDHYWIEKAGLALPKGGTYNFLFHHPNPINAAVRLALDSNWALWGQPLKDRMHQYFHDEIWMECEIFGEFLPWQGCSMDLDPGVKDRFGLPAARISIKHHPADQEVSRWMVKQSMDVFNAIKPAPKQVNAWTWGTTTYHLQGGTCRFGTEPSQSVLDPSCQAHEVKNLYVTDGSFMPTSGGAPATPTIIANSFRVADIIAERFRRKDID